MFSRLFGMNFKTSRNWMGSPTSD